MNGITQETLNTISRVYDGSLSPDEWPLILDDLAGHFNATGSALFYSDDSNPEIPPVATCYSDFWRSHREAEYLEKVLEVEPSARMLRKRKPRTIVTNDNLSITEKLSILTYGLRMKMMFGIEAMLVSSLTETGAWFDYITFQFDGKHGAVKPDEERQLQLLVPHISKAIEISRPMTVLERRFNRVIEALDHFRVGVFIISESNNIVIKNETASKIISLNDGLYISQNKGLRANNDISSGELRRALSNAISTSLNNEAVCESLLKISRNSKKEEFLLDLAPIGSSQNIFGHPINGAIVMAIDPSDPGTVSTKGMKELYGLSRSEIEICQAVVDGFSNPEIAEMRNVSPETVKSQVKSTFIKTNTINRSELIRRALSINLPIDKL